MLLKLVFLIKIDYNCVDKIDFDITVGETDGEDIKYTRAIYTRKRK